MLGTVAQEPRTIDEQIQKADVPAMITMINKSDPYQKQWFTALLNTQVLQCPDSIRCIERWSHLCTLGDISRLLNQSISSKDTRAKNLVIKCAATLDFEELVLATTRHFYQNGITSHLNENVQEQLVVIFNKIKDKNIDDEFSKELYLLLLQNLEQTLSYTFGEYLKNTFYSSNLSTVWPHVKQIATIDDVGIKVLRNEINNNVPNEHNCKNYVELLNILVQMNVFSPEVLSVQIILPLLQDSYSKENYDVLRYTLEILKDWQADICLKQETENLISFLLDLIKSCRCKFQNFSRSKQEIVKVSVNIVEKCSSVNGDPYAGQMVKSEEDLFLSFYKRKLYKLDYDILEHFFPINFENHAETVAYLSKILSCCVTPEWVMISSKLVEVCHIEKTVELLCDTMILLCELVNSQDTKTEEVKCMLSALKYCLQNLGVVIKECIQPRINDLQQDIALTKNVCRLLKDIPAGNLRSEEGLSLASLLSDLSLKFLKYDKRFACLVGSIHESHIRKMLSLKILS